MIRLTYSKAEAAEAIGISERLVQREIQAGRIPAVHIGATVRIPKSALSIWLDKEAFASLQEQAVADYITGMPQRMANELLQGEDFTRIELGSVRAARSNKRKPQHVG